MFSFTLSHFTFDKNSETVYDNLYPYEKIVRDFLKNKEFDEIFKYNFNVMKIIKISNMIAILYNYV